MNKNRIDTYIRAFSLEQVANNVLAWIIHILHKLFVALLGTAIVILSFPVKTNNGEFVFLGQNSQCYAKNRFDEVNKNRWTISRHKHEISAQLNRDLIQLP